MKLIALACLVAYVGLACAAEAPGSNSTQGFSCDAVAKVPSQQRCSFLTSSCPSESLVPYARWYYCSVAHHNIVLRFFYVALVSCLLPLAFCLLGDTAEFYIAPIMAHVSQAIPKMRPRFAGVTFVALGNGAPDLSSNIAAISAGEVVLSAGALTGAAMFVQCIVAAELVALAGPGGIKCGGAMLRDVGVYCLAIFSVLLAFTIGQVSRAFVGWALALYIIYMAWVFAGDEWHQRGRPRPSITAASFKALLAGQLPLADALAFAGGGGGTAAAGGAGAAQAGRPGPRGAARHSSNSGESGLEETLLPWAVAEDEEFVAPEQQFQAFDQQQQQQLGYVGVPGARQLRIPSSLREASITTELSDFAVGGSSGGSGASLLQGSLLSPPGAGSSSSSSMTAAAAGGDLAAAARASLRASSATAASGQLSHSQQQPGQDQRRWSHSSSSAASQQQQQLRGGASSGAFGWASPPQHHQQQQQPHLLSLGGNQSYIDAKTYKQLVWADLADDQEEEQRLERQIARQLLAATRHTGGRSRSSGDEAAGSYQPPLAAAAAAAGPDQQQHPSAEMQQVGSPAAAGSLQQQQQQQQQQPFVDSRLLLSPFGPATDRSGQSTPVGLAAAASPIQHQQQQAAGPLSSSEGDTWQQLQWQVTLGNSEDWQNAGPIRKGFRKVMFPLLLPAYLGQRLTIPFASGAGYSREWLIAALLCCPLAAITYLGWLSLPAIYAACGCGVAAACAAAALTCRDAPGQMPAQGLGGPVAAVAPGLLAVLAFCMGVAWIDTVATEVVGAVTFLAGLASLPSGVMGLTLLAWGNSLGDFFGNRAMAKAGHTSTAITACFAAPLFNMLVSLALGFSAYLHQLGATSVRVRLTPEVALGCLFLMGYNVAIICVGKLCGQRLPPWFAHFARAWYGLYFSLAVVSGFMNNKR